MTIRELGSFPILARAFYQNKWKNILLYLHTPAVLVGAGLFGLFVVLLAIIQFATPDLAGNDGYFHIRLAQIMRQQGLHPPFPWLPLTILNPESYVDHHFLYHVLLIPFTFGNLRVGAKWASVVLPALTFLSGWIVLRGQRVPFDALWAIGFFGVSEAFLYRMSMPRVQAVSLLVLLLGLHFVLTQRHHWLLPLSFFYVWLYDAFPLMLMLVGIYVFARWLVEGKFNVTPLVYCGLGIGLGLLINPYFPDNLLFIYHHFLPKLTDTTAIRVGGEWHPYQTWTLVQNSGFALLAFLSGIVALGLREKRMSTATATVLLLAILFGAMLFKSRRFIEYFPAFALMFCAFAWAPLFKDWIRAKEWIARELPVMMTIILILTIVWNVQHTQESLQASKPFQRYADASLWLQTNTPAGSRVFQTDWDDFTRLYFYNTHNTYTVGLDPTYMQLYDPELYDLWADITQGQVATPSRIIDDTFGAGYVLTDLKHKSFLNSAKTDPHLAEVYRDEYAAIFRVLTQSDAIKGKEGG